MLCTVTYFSSLVLCVCVGNFYKTLNGKEEKRNYGTVLGFLVVLLICGPHIFHVLFMVLGNIAIITNCKKSYVHRASFMYTWLYLLLFFFNVKSSTYELWINQVIALRMVGLAFEVYFADKENRDIDESGLNEYKQYTSDESCTYVEPPWAIAAPSKAPKIEENDKESLNTEADKEPLKATEEAVTNATETSKELTQVEKEVLQTTKAEASKPETEAEKEEAPKTKEAQSVRINTVANTKRPKLTPPPHVTPVAPRRRPSRSILVGRVEPQTSRNPIIAFKPTELDPDVITRTPNVLDVLTYAFFFIGLHKGPYYRWKIYEDHFSNSFGVLGDCHVITEQKLKKSLVCFIMYTLLRLKFHPQAYFQPYFYEVYGPDYRYLYSVPQLLMYVLQYQIVLLLCTSVCTESGFGVYPAKTQPVSGHGPTVSLSLLKLASQKADVALEQEYNFSMLKCFENEQLFLGPRMLDTLQSWDMATRYWFRMYTYENFISGSRKLRSLFSFLAWTVWLGPSIQQLIISFTLWFYLQVEERFSHLYDTRGSMKVSWNIGFSIMRGMCLVYLTPCLVISDGEAVLRYYNSINWIFHLVLVCLVVYAIVVFKCRHNNVL